MMSVSQTKGLESDVHTEEREFTNEPLVKKQHGGSGWTLEWVGKAGVISETRGCRKPISTCAIDQKIFLLARS